MDIIIFDTTKELYKFLRDTDSLKKLRLFRDTKENSIPPDNIGYVVLDDSSSVIGAASLYEEGIGIWFNEIFEIIPEYRGKGVGKYLYEYIKSDLEPDMIHGFATTAENKSFWEHMGQKCIDQDTNEMLEILE